MTKGLTLILLSFWCIINAQIALPTFQGVHKPHTSSSSSGTVTFTNCSATGRLGPTQSQVNSTYTSGNSLYGEATINIQGIQEWTVPATTTYTIEAWGAEGGESAGWGQAGYCPAGQGGYASGDLAVTPGQVLHIYVGGQGDTNTAYESLSAGGWNGGGDGMGGWSGNFMAASINTRSPFRYCVP